MKERRAVENVPPRPDDEGRTTFPFREGASGPGSDQGGNEQIMSSIIWWCTDAILTVDLDGKITGWNPSAERILGSTSEEAVGRPLSVMMRSMTGDVVQDIIGRLEREEEVPYRYILHHGRNGKAIKGFVRYSPIKDREGRFCGASVMVSPIKEECEPIGGAYPVRGERIGEIEILDMLPTYMVLLSSDHRILFSNRYFRDHFGKTDGRPCYECLFDRTAPCENCETFTVLATGIPHQWEWVGPDGFNYDVFDYPLVTEGGSKMVLEVGINITKRKRFEEDLRKVVAYNRSLIEASMDPLVTIGPDGKITDVNVATETVTGRSRGDLIGTDFSDYFTEPEMARAGYEQVFREGMVRDYALKIRSRDGTIIPVLYNATIYRDDAGKVIGVFAAARDVTSQHRMEVELLEQRRRELDRLAELEKFQRLTVGRELKMVELKEEIRALKAENEELKERLG